MSWLRIDDCFTQNPKVLPLTDKAFRLHVTALCYCARNLTDGEIHENGLTMLLAEAKTNRKAVRELESAHLWHKQGSWWIKDYLEYNPSREKVLQERAKAKDRQRRHREFSTDCHAVSHAVSHGVSHGVSHAAPAPTPTPEQLIDISAVSNSAGPVEKLLDALTDKDDKTRAVITSIALKGGLSEGDLMYARECAMGPGVVSPTRVAVNALKQRAKEKAA